LGVAVAQIDVERTGSSDVGPRFHVVVREGDSSTAHDVTASNADLDRLASSYPSPEAFVEACFAFLLEREPKGSILAAFDISAIGRYFPEFERTISREG
jgi:hypothetical protein